MTSNNRINDGKLCPLRIALNTSEFAQWMHAHRGQTVARTAIQAAFKQSFKQVDASAMQLRCASKLGSSNKDILTEIWLTIPTAQLAQFPQPESFGPGLRGNCAAKIQILQN